ncbi:hypothetical protein B0H17DRAFT_1134017 [Mycena rosella]|uniref:Uncharacterized protein n=1 Tax=Mycena rosella TaxID=1033263 RepID=A0AAD7DGE5_MYCRO|nr:hypothetical protein B0H17DRAFT_1134017 [Mycena rosella]
MASSSSTSSSENSGPLLYPISHSVPLVDKASAHPSSQAKLSLIIRPIPTGPRAGLHPRSAPSKRRRVEEGKDTGENSPIPASNAPYARPSRPMPYVTHGSSSIRPAIALSEGQLCRRLAAVQAEIRRFSAAQKELLWQLQTIRQPRPVNPAPIPQVRLD